LPPSQRVDPATGVLRLKPRATSPTLADTDGDGVSDYDELNSTNRNGVIADLPLLITELVGDVDVRLHVEYAETAGQTHEYGTTLTESKSQTVGSSFSQTLGWSLDVGFSTSFEESEELNAGTKQTQTFSINTGVHADNTWTVSTETSQESS